MGEVENKDKVLEEEYEAKPSGKGKVLVWVIVVLVGLVVIVGGVYVWYTGEQRKEAERLFQEAMDLPKDERGEKLLELLDRSLHESFKAQVVEELGYLYYKPALNKLVLLIKGGDRVSWKAALASAMILSHHEMIGSEEAKQLCDKVYPLLEKASGIGKAHFAYAMVLLGDRRGVEPLLESMYDGFTKDIEGFTPRLVARLITPEQIVKMLDNPDPAVKVFAIQVSGEMRAKEAFQKLVSLLELKGNQVIVKEAAQALAKIDPKTSGPLIIKLMKEQPELRNELLLALRDSVGVEGLLPLYNEGDWAKKNEIVEHLRLPPPSTDHTREIRGIGDPRVVDLCYDLYKNGPTERTKLHGLWCLEEFGDERAKEGLMQLADDENPIDDLSDEAIRSLGRLKFEGSRELFIKMLKERRGRPATLLVALGRQKNPEDGVLISPYADCANPEATDCDESVALRALGMTGWSKALSHLIKKAKRGKNEKEAQDIASRDWTREGRLMSRRSAILGLGFLGDPKASDFLMSVIEDTGDDPEVRLFASESLGYCIDDIGLSKVVARIKESRLDHAARKYYINTLRIKINREAIDYLLELLQKDDTDEELLIPIGLALGEAGKELVPLEPLLKVVKEHRLNSHRVASALALLLGGYSEAIDDLIQVFETTPSLHNIVKDNFENYPIYITDETFQNLKIFNKLDTAWAMRAIDKLQYGWAWNYIIDRLRVGWDEKPRGLTPVEIRERLLNYLMDADKNMKLARLAGRALMGMGLKGYLIMVVGRGGTPAEVAKEVLDEF